MADEIKAGDVVQLKSVGPGMTASKIDTLNGVLTAWCVWFEGSTNKSATFPVASLKRAD